MFMRLLLLLRPSLDQAACGWTLVGEGVLALLRRQATADGRLRESLDRLQSANDAARCTHVSLSRRPPRQDCCWLLVSSCRSWLIFWLSLPKGTLKQSCYRFIAHTESHKQQRSNSSCCIRSEQAPLRTNELKPESCHFSEVF